jgi:hypothetical protein
LCASASSRSRTTFASSVDHGFFARVALRRVHLPVGLRHQLLGCQPVLREQRPADGGVELDRPAVDAVRTTERLAQPAHERRGLGILLRAERENDELVPADAGNRVALPDDRLEAPRGRPQHDVTRLVAPRVVDPLEAVEVDDHQRERLTRAPGPGERLLNAVVEELPVRETGQRVSESGALGRSHPPRQEPRGERGDGGHRQSDRYGGKDASLAPELEAGECA